MEALWLDEKEAMTLMNAIAMVALSIMERPPRLPDFERDPEQEQETREQLRTLLDIENRLTFLYGDLKGRPDNASNS